MAYLEQKRYVHCDLAGMLISTYFYTRECRRFSEYAKEGNLFDLIDRNHRASILNRKSTR